MTIPGSAYWPVELESAFDQDTKLPVLSPIALRVVQLSDDPLCDSRRLGETISGDPGLSARVLKLANSSFYGYGGQVTNLQQAIVLLGFGTIKNVILGISLTDLFPRMPSSKYVDHFWQDSYLTGCLAFLIARSIRHPNQAYAFTAGLLHDVGKLVLQTKYPAETRAIGEKASDDAEALKMEGECFGFNHAHVGAWLAATWKFPDALIEAIGRHNDPDQATCDGLLTTIVCVAGHLKGSRDETLPDGIPDTLLIHGIDRDLLTKVWDSWYKQRDGHLSTLDLMKTL